MLISNSAETAAAPRDLESATISTGKHTLAAPAQQPRASPPASFPLIFQKGSALLLGHSRLPAALCRDDVCRTGRWTQSGKGTRGTTSHHLPL